MPLWQYLLELTALSVGARYVAVPQHPGVSYGDTRSNSNIRLIIKGCTLYGTEKTNEESPNNAAGGSHLRSYRGRRQLRIAVVQGPPPS